MPKAATSNQPLSTLFAGTRLGLPRGFGGLTLVPLLRDGQAGPDAMLLEEGIAQGCTRVTESDEARYFHTIVVDHQGTAPLLVLNGEQILVEKNNHAFDESLVVLPGVNVKVSASWMDWEWERWPYRANAPPTSAAERESHEPMPTTHAGEGFRASEFTLTGSMRSRTLSRATRSQVTGFGFDGDQRAVWRDIDEYLTRIQARSETCAYDDEYRTRAREVEGLLERAKPEPGQVGMAAVAGDRLVGLDVFGSVVLYARAWKKVLRGVLADEYGPASERTDPVRLVEQVMDMLVMPGTNRATLPGCGETIRAVVGVLAMGAVALEGEVVHAYATQV